MAAAENTKGKHSMASISRDANGTRRILFVDSNGDRKAIRLGKVSQNSAMTIKLRVEQLLESIILNRPMESSLAEWVADLDKRLAVKLAAVGLIARFNDKPAATLGEQIDAYLAKRTDVKQSTRVRWGHARRTLIEFFGADRPLASVTAGDARDWERWLKTGEARENRYGEREAKDGLAPNTVRKRVSDAKQFFQDAVQRETLARNPFAGLKGTVGSNRDRDYFLSRTDAEKILEACPDAQWRLIFALSRFGGLRCPSEHLALTWDDIDWGRNRMRVRSPKTEHHEGKSERFIPIFPELRPYLDEVYHTAPPGTVYVITRYRDASQNLRTTFQKIILRAGLTPWPKLFQNLRATRATELATENPAHVAAAWLGHSTVVASKHYWQVTDADFDRALSGELQSGAENGALLAQNRAQHTAAEFGSESQNASGDCAETLTAKGVKRHPAVRYETLLKTATNPTCGRSGTRTPTPLGTRS